MLSFAAASARRRSAVAAASRAAAASHRAAVEEARVRLGRRGPRLALHVAPEDIARDLPEPARERVAHRAFLVALGPTLLWDLDLGDDDGGPLDDVEDAEALDAFESVFCFKGERGGGNVSFLSIRLSKSKGKK